MLKSIIGVAALLSATAFAAIQSSNSGKVCPGGGCHSASADTAASTASAGPCCQHDGCAKSGAAAMVSTEKPSEHCCGVTGCCAGDAGRVAVVSAEASGKGCCAEGTCTAGSCCDSEKQVAVSVDKPAKCGSESAVAAGGCTTCLDGRVTAVSTTACDAHGCDKKSCADGTCGADCKDCPIAAAMKRLPQMTFTVGTETTTCPKTAAKLAEKSGAKIHYVVGKKTFDSKSEALASLADATEHFVAEFSEPHVCDQSETVTLAGQTMKCKVTAAKMAKTAKDAMNKVQMTYLVGTTECHCPNEAAKLAKESGQEELFVVGKEKTCCSVTARLNLARAKYRAAVVALMQVASKQARNAPPAKKELAGSRSARG